MICENTINNNFIFHISKINENKDISQYIIDQYLGKCIKNIGVVNKIKSIDIEPAQISGSGFLLKHKISLEIESIIPKLNCIIRARAAKIYDFALFYPVIAGQNCENIKIVVSDISELEEGEMYDIELIHFKFSNGNYNCMARRGDFSRYQV